MAPSSTRPATLDLAALRRRVRGPGYVVALHAGAEDRDEKVAWVEGLVRDLHPAPGAYVNFLADEGIERVRAAYPGATWDRLAAIKRRHDPDNLFRGTQNVPPAPDGA